MQRGDSISRELYGPRVLWGLFALGIVISLVMIARVYTGNDGVSMLAHGWLLIEKGVWVPLGNAASGGGYVPGGLTALVSGIPLMLWMDHRAPLLLLLILHCVGFVLMDRIIKETLGQRARVIFAVVYWLNPWRMFGAGWLDNANYAFFAGAINFWACYRQREKPSLWHSMVMVATVGLAVQLHMNAVLLVFSSALLWWRRCWKPHWGGVFLGAAIAIGSLIPYLMLAQQYPDVLPAREGISRDWYLRIWSALKGVSYWLRYGSYYASGTSIYFYDFGNVLGQPLAKVVTYAMNVLAVLASTTVVLSVKANISQWRLWRSDAEARGNEPCSDRAWLREYAMWTLIGCAIGNAISQISVMWWHNLVAMHAAAIPVVLWADDLMRTRFAGYVRGAMMVCVPLSVVLMLGIAFGGEYHRGPPSPITMTSRHEMLQQVRIQPFHSDKLPRTDEFFYEHFMRPYELPPVGDPDDSTSSAESPQPAELTEDHDDF